jgi:hypothetical protein
VENRIRMKACNRHEWEHVTQWTETVYCPKCGRVVAPQPDGRAAYFRSGIGKPYHVTWQGPFAHPEKRPKPKRRKRPAYVHTCCWVKLEMRLTPKGAIVVEDLGLLRAEWCRRCHRTRLHWRDGIVSMHTLVELRGLWQMLSEMTSRSESHVAGCTPSEPSTWLTVKVDSEPSAMRPAEASGSVRCVLVSSRRSVLRRW